jgi:hypothetical protein
MENGDWVKIRYIPDLSTDSTGLYNDVFGTFLNHDLGRKELDQLEAYLARMSVKMTFENVFQITQILTQDESRITFKGKFNNSLFTYGGIFPHWEEIQAGISYDDPVPVFFVWIDDKPVNVSDEVFLKKRCQILTPKSELHLGDFISVTYQVEQKVCSLQGQLLFYDTETSCYTVHTTEGCRHEIIFLNRPDQIVLDEKSVEVFQPIVIVTN